MLEIKTACLEDIHILKELLKKSDVEVDGVEHYISNCMIAYDHHTAVAAAGFIQTNNIGVIQFVTVINTRRREYLGDSIVKALLNLADKKGINKMVAALDHCDLFFQKVGFQEVPLNEIKPHLENISGPDLSGKDKVCIANLPDFFLKACKHHH